MHFPVDIVLFGLRFPPHAVMEGLAYVLGFQVYRMMRRRFPQALVGGEAMAWVLVGCVIGAVAGSKVLAWVESINEYWPLLHEPQAWLGAKTIVGGLLGGWIGVEIVKKRLGIKHSTGDGFVFPLIVGIAVGRVGCFLSGLADHTYGLPTSLPWGVDFGDGVSRHPAQLYEILFLLMLAVALALYHRKPRPNGRLFLLFMLGYLSWRVFIEFYKPRLMLAGPLSAIQMASMAGVVVCLVMLWKRQSPGSRRPVFDEFSTDSPCPTAPISSSN